MTKNKLISRVASDILLSFPLNLTERCKPALESLAASAEETRGTEDYCSAQFNRPGKTSDSWSNDIELSVATKAGELTVEEESGDIYQDTKLVFTVSWSSYSRAVTTDTTERLQLMLAVAAAVEDLTQKYSGTHRTLVRTKAQEADRLARVEAEKIIAKVKVAAEYVAKGLRAGGNARSVARALFEGIPDGTYTVTYRPDRGESKTYNVSLSTYSARVRRTA